MSSKVGFPPQIRYIIGQEACERFSYYGMRSILVIFMVQYLLMSKADSLGVFHLFVSACYLLPVAGAYLSDRFLGKYKTILYLSLFYCVGHGILAIWENKAGMFWGLFFISLGAGGIKSCVAAHVGDQFTEKNKHLIQRVYDIFYFSVNFGSTFSTIMIPWILPRYGAGWAFGIPGILMAAATFVFWMGRDKYVHVPPTRETGNTGFIPIFAYALKHLGKSKGDSFLDVAKNKFSSENVEAVKAAFKVIKVFLLISGFWALFDQHSSSWVLQADKMERTFWGMPLEASQISALNPIMVMVLIPIFAYGIYPLVEKLGIKLTPLRKMSAGMFIAGTSFAVVGLLEIPLEAGHKVSVAWQFIPYLLLTISEIMISIPGLELAYTQAPRSMKSTIMSFWYLTVFFGNMLTAFISKINVFQGPTFFFFFAILVSVMGVAFVWVATRYQYKNYLEK